MVDVARKSTILVFHSVVCYRGKMHRTNSARSNAYVHRKRKHHCVISVLPREQCSSCSKFSVESRVPFDKRETKAVRRLEFPIEI